MREPISVGVVGCGYWGPNIIRNLKSLRNCHVKAVCDASETRLKYLRSLYPEIDGVNDYSYLINEKGIEAVVIATPVKYHHALAKESLLAGKHTFIEKPMASSAAECEELIEIAQQNGLVLMVGHTFLYSSPVAKIREIVRAGDIGEIRYINSRRLNLGLFQKDINVAWDLAPHDISIILHLLGELPLTVNCQGNAHVTPCIDDVTNMSLTFGSNRFATIQSSWIEPKKVREMTIVGSRRMIVYDDVEPVEKIRIYDTRVERPPHCENLKEFQYSYHYGDCHIPKIEHIEPLKVECQHFLECIETGSKPLTCGQSGLELVRILEAASESLNQKGAPIMLSSLTEAPMQRRGFALQGATIA